MTIQDHEAKKPIRTKAIKDMTQAEYNAWSNTLADWSNIKDGIIARESVKGMEDGSSIRERNMRERACSPKADYEWRDIPTRKSKPSRPKWEGATPEYMAKKRRESKVRSAAGLTCLDCPAPRHGKSFRCAECKQAAERARKDRHNAWSRKYHADKRGAA
jgi:hypothetical protein